MAALYDGFVPSAVITVAAQATQVIRPDEGYEARLHHVFHSGAGKLEITDGTNVVLLDSGTANCFYNNSIVLTRGLYALFTSTELSASQTLVYNGVISKVPTA